MSSRIDHVTTGDCLRTKRWLYGLETGMNTTTQESDTTGQIVKGNLYLYLTLNDIMAAERRSVRSSSGLAKWDVIFSDPKENSSTTTEGRKRKGWVRIKGHMGEAEESEGLQASQLQLSGANVSELRCHPQDRAVY